MANTYIAVSIEEDNKNYAYAIKVTESDNLLGKLEVKGIKYANICGTKKRASEIVDYWNNGYKQNGTYMFAEPF